MSSKVLSLFKLALLLTLLTLAVYFLRFTDAGRSITPARFKEFVESVDPLWAPFLYITVYVFGTVLLLPGTVMSFAGAILFGAYLGTLYTWIGATIGATLAFLVAKLLFSLITIRATRHGHPIDLFSSYLLTLKTM